MKTLSKNFKKYLTHVTPPPLGAGELFLCSFYCALIELDPSLLPPSYVERQAGIKSKSGTKNSAKTNSTTIPNEHRTISLESSGRHMWKMKKTQIDSSNGKNVKIPDKLNSSLGPVSPLRRWILPDTWDYEILGLPEQQLKTKMASRLMWGVVYFDQRLSAAHSQQLSSRGGLAVE